MTSQSPSASDKNDHDVSQLCTNKIDKQFRKEFGFNRQRPQFSFQQIRGTMGLSAKIIAYIKGAVIMSIDFRG
jgi:hypothetical protein